MKAGGGDGRGCRGMDMMVDECTGLYEAGSLPAPLSGHNIRSGH